MGMGPEFAQNDEEKHFQVEGALFTPVLDKNFSHADAPHAQASPQYQHARDLNFKRFSTGVDHSPNRLAESRHSLNSAGLRGNNNQSNLFRL